MKIAVFYNLSFGGAKRVVYEHVKGLRHLGHAVDVYTTDPYVDIFNPSNVADKSFVYKYHGEKNNIPVLGRFYSDYQNFFVLKNLHKKIASDIDKEKYDLVLAHPDRSTQSPFILRFLKTPSIYYCQEPLRIAYEYSFRLKESVSIVNKVYEEITRYYRKRIDRINVRSATLTLASCYHVRERMIEAYDVSPKVSYLGVDEKVFKKMNLKKKNQLIFIGSKELPLDGYELAQKAIDLIPKSKRPKLQTVVWRKSNGERLSDEELVVMYNESIATLCMSRLETFGLVPLEAMSCGTPVIATNVSGHRETVANNESGFLVDFEPAEIATKIEEIMSNGQLAKKLSEGGRKHIEKFWKWERRIDELETLLQNFLKSQKKKK